MGAYTPHVIASGDERFHLLLLQENVPVTKPAVGSLPEVPSWEQGVEMWRVSDEFQYQQEVDGSL